MCQALNLVTVIFLKFIQQSFCWVTNELNGRPRYTKALVSAYASMANEPSPFTRIVGPISVCVERDRENSRRVEAYVWRNEQFSIVQGVTDSTTTSVKIAVTVSDSVTLIITGV